MYTHDFRAGASDADTDCPCRSSRKHGSGTRRTKHSSSGRGSLCRSGWLVLEEDASRLCERPHPPFFSSSIQFVIGGPSPGRPPAPAAGGSVVSWTAPAPDRHTARPVSHASSRLAARPDPPRAVGGSGGESQPPPPPMSSPKPAVVATPSPPEVALPQAPEEVAPEATGTLAPEVLALFPGAHRGAGGRRITSGANT